MFDGRRWSALARGALLTATVCSLARADLAVVPAPDTNANTARQLAQLLAPGVNITSAAFIGDRAAFGVFSGGSSAGLDLEQGVLLGTGSVVDAIGPNDDPEMSTPWGLPGDNQLSQLLGSDSVDAAVLTFQFTCPAGSQSALVDYVFASDAYESVDNPWDIDERDGAAILIDGVNAATLAGGAPLSVPTLPTQQPLSFRDNDACHVDEPARVPVQPASRRLLQPADGARAHRGQRRAQRQDCHRRRLLRGRRLLDLPARLHLQRERGPGAREARARVGTAGRSGARREPARPELPRPRTAPAVRPRSAQLNENRCSMR